MESFGAMWLDASREWQGRNALSVELLYTVDGEPGIAQLANRIGELHARGVRVLLRVDLEPGQTIPVEGDFVGKYEFAHFFERLAQDPVICQVGGIIVGNEPNLKAENVAGGDGGISAAWYMTVHSGVYAAADDDADVYTQLRTNGYTGDVLVAAPAPWSDDTDGTLESYPTPPGATGTMPWLRYAATLYWLAYNAGRMAYNDVKGSVHTYSNVLACQQLGLDPALEPTYVGALRNPDWNMCQYGIRVYDEFLEQMNVQAGGAGDVVPHYVTEWNSLVGRVDDDLADPAWPCNNYPVGLLENVVHYLKHKPNLMGFAMFVDRDESGESPFWLASSARGYLTPADLDEGQQARLRNWDSEFDRILQRGWS
jgi:hypothetical protein